MDQRGYGCWTTLDASPGASWMPNISAWPNDASVCSLSSVLETGPIPQRYYLSARACAGILRRAEKRGKDSDTAGSLKVGGGKPGQGYPAAMQGAAVRRLTPRECERLQGFEDDYTAIPYRGRVAADGNRYRALGNSMAVPVISWLGRAIEATDAA
jgi:site-specific DNA-cytosine methylase